MTRYVVTTVTTVMVDEDKCRAWATPPERAINVILRTGENPLGHVDRVVITNTTRQEDPGVPATL